MDQTAVRTAKCQCGALTAECHGEPWRRSLCHCFACKARTRSAFGVQATYDEEQVTLAGSASLFERTGAEGHWVRQYFCGQCGTTLYWRIERRPGAVSIAAGCFGTNQLVPPTSEVYGDCAMAGMTLKISPEPVQQ